MAHPEKRYERLSQDDNSSVNGRLEEAILAESLSGRDNGRHSIFKNLAILVGFLLSCAACFLFGRSWSHGKDIGHIDTAWVDLKQSIKYERVEFDPRFEGEKSPYMGDPSPVVDKLWYDLAAIPNFAVDYDTLSRINRTQGAVQYPKSKLYQVGLEVYHQLHCLNYLRMYTFEDHYAQIDPDMMFESEEERKEHKNHCVEELRQSLMCQPDLNIYTYHWVKVTDRPYGNLFTPHTCVDWEALNEWTSERIMRESVGRKPEGADLLP